MKLSAKDVYDPGFDIFSGHGLLKVDSAPRLLQQPNVLRQWQSGTPTVYDVSGYTLRVFYVPGLGSGPYYAKTYQLRADVTFPKTYHNFVDSWGRGSLSNGWSFANPNYGLGYCSFVPGTLSPQGGTLQTVVYEVKTIVGVPLGFHPCAPEEAFMAYTALGEELLESPVLSAEVDAPYQHGGDAVNAIELSWRDSLANETAWHIDRKIGSGAWEIDWAVLPLSSASYTDTDILYGSELYTYRIRPVNVNQTPPYSQEVTVRSRPNPPSCVSAYVLNVNLLDPFLDPSLCLGNEGECGGPEPPEGPMGPMGGPMGGQSAMQGSGSGCVPSQTIVVEWLPPENQVGSLNGYMISKRRAFPLGFFYYDLTTNLTDTICGGPDADYDLSVVVEDVYGNASEPVIPYLTLTTGSIDYCNWGYIEKRSADLSDERTARNWEFAVRDNRPNPFNAGTILAFTLPRSESWNLTIHDILGRVIRRFDGRGGPGLVEVSFDGRTTAGEELATGVYFWRLHTPTASGVRKMMIVK